MVMIKNPVKSVLVPLAIGTLMVIDGCKKDEAAPPAPAPPTNTDLLIGDWNLVEQDGTPTDPSATYNLLFKFQSSGDWQFCYEFPATPADNYCDYSAKWRWQDANEKTIIIDQFSGAAGLEWKIDVVLLDATNLNGTLTLYAGYSFTVKFEKVL